jgi:hypothetical protein
LDAAAKSLIVIVPAIHDVGGAEVLNFANESWEDAQAVAEHA